MNDTRFLLGLMQSFVLGGIARRTDLTHFINELYPVEHFSTRQLKDIKKFLVSMNAFVTDGSAEELINRINNELIERAWL